MANSANCNRPSCRSCGAVLTHTFCDLGTSPPSNAYLSAAQLHSSELFFPLHAYVCEKCWLVQIEQFQLPEEIFADYAYFSSYSRSWLDHCKTFARSASEQFGINSSSQVVEIASNDGYLLQFFVEMGIPVLGIEPAANVARYAKEKGIRSVVRFFGFQTAKDLVAEGIRADLLIGNNVLAHVPDLNDFVSGLKTLLHSGGVISMEFPHLLRLIEENQFDTIYHEHFSYFSCLSVSTVFERHGLTIFDVEEIPTHGGSLRLFARHAEATIWPIRSSVLQLIDRERQAGLENVQTYDLFSERVTATKRSLLKFLIKAKEDGKNVVGYGAAAKGNTLLNYCGIRSDFLDYVVDRSPHKQGKFLPGTHLPIFSPDRLSETKPDYVLILPWNIKSEIIEQIGHIREWGGQFVVPIPEVSVV